MGKIENLVRNYERDVSLPWQQNLAGPQRVWFAVYDKGDERRLRGRIGEFEVATKHACHKWACCDVTDSFAEWLGKEPYAESYFEDPDALDTNLRTAASITVWIIAAWRHSSIWTKACRTGCACWL